MCKLDFAKSARGDGHTRPQGDDSDALEALLALREGRDDMEHDDVPADAPTPAGAHSSHASDSTRYFCPHPGCKRSFAELWRLKVHYRCDGRRPAASSARRGRIAWGFGVARWRGDGGVWVRQPAVWGPLLAPDGPGSTRSVTQGRRARQQAGMAARPAVGLRAPQRRRRTRRPRSNTAARLLAPPPPPRACRAPPNIRGSGKERGHGMRLTHCPKVRACVRVWGCALAAGSARQPLQRPSCSAARLTDALCCC
jgi:hypothetical protein